MSKERPSNFIYKRSMSIRNLLRPSAAYFFRSLWCLAVYKLIALLLILCLVLPPLGFSQEQKPSELPKVKDAKIALDVKGMNIVDVLKILADEGGLNLSIGGNVQGRITLFLKNIDVWDAFEIVAISSDLAYEKRGDIIYIMPEREYELKYGKKYWDNRQLKVFSLKYAKAAKAGAIFSQVASKVGKVIIDETTNTIVVIDIPDKIQEMADVVTSLDRPLETRIFELNYLPVNSIQEKLTQLLSPDVGSLKADELSNKIAVTDYPEKINELDKILIAFDEKPLQVLIDAKIIELRPSKDFYSGVDWGYWIQKYFEVQGVFKIPTTSTDKITLGTISHENVSHQGDYKGIMEFLEIFGETRVLSTPRILALNNQEAKILVGSREAYITESISQTDGSAITAQTVNFVDVGVKLYVTPTINRAGYITLKIRPEISSAETETITHEDKTTEIPIVSTSEAETTIIVRDGVNIILGGLHKITQEKEKKQVPFLGSIPFFGWIFRNKKDEWSKDELVILLTPHIVSGDKSIEQELYEKEEALWEKEALDELEKLNQQMKHKKDAAQEKPQSSFSPKKEKLAAASMRESQKGVIWEKQAMLEFQKMKADEAMYEKKALAEAKKIGDSQMWEKEALRQFQLKKAQQAMLEEEALLELQKMQERLVEEKQNLDEFLAADNKKDTQGQP